MSLREAPLDVRIPTLSSVRRLWPGSKGRSWQHTPLYAEIHPGPVIGPHGIGFTMVRWGRGRWSVRSMRAPVRMSIQRALRHDVHGRIWAHLQLTRKTTACARD